MRKKKKEGKNKKKRRKGGLCNDKTRIGKEDIYKRK